MYGFPWLCDPLFIEQLKANKALTNYSMPEWQDSWCSFRWGCWSGLCFAFEHGQCRKAIWFCSKSTGLSTIGWSRCSCMKELFKFWFWNSNIIWQQNRAEAFFDNAPLHFRRGNCIEIGRMILGWFSLRNSCWSIETWIMVVYFTEGNTHASWIYVGLYKFQRITLTD